MKPIKTYVRRMKPIKSYVRRMKLIKSYETPRLIVRLIANSFPIVMAGLIVAYAIGLGKFRDHSIFGATISGKAGELLWFATICGLSSMATLEVLKRVLGLRGLYQQRQILRWLVYQSNGDTGPRAFDELCSATGLTTNSKDSVSGILRPFQDAQGLFNLPMEQVAAQISEAAELAIARKGRESALVACLAGVSETPESGAEAPQVGVDEPPADDPTVSGNQTKDAGSLAQSVQAGVDALQISVGQRWRVYVRSTAVWVSGGIGILLVRSEGTVSTGGESVLILTALVLGGTFAWFARDLLALVERLRR